MFSFYINGVEILDKISDVIRDKESTVDIICEPEVPFKVFSVTRCSSTLPGHASAVLDVQCSPDGRLHFFYTRFVINTSSFSWLKLILIIILLMMIITTIPLLIKFKYEETD